MTGKITMTAFMLALTVLLVVSPSAATSSAVVYTRPGDVPAMDWNPAFLGTSPYYFQMHLDIINMEAWTNAWTIATILENMNAFQDEQAKPALLKRIRGTSFGVGGNISTGVYCGLESLGIASRIKADTAFGIDKSLFELILHGFTLDDLEASINLADTYGNLAVIADNSVSYALPLTNMADSLDWHNLYLGIGLHYLYGLAFGQISIDKAELTLDNTFRLTGTADANVIYSAVGLGGGGHGFAFDIGMWGKINPHLGVGLALNNLGVVWWRDVHKIGTASDFYLDFSQLIANILGDEETWFDYNLPEDLIPEVLPGSYAWSTPIGLQGGVAYAVSPRILLGGSLGFNQAPIPHLAFGAATRLLYPHFLPLTFAMDYAGYKGTPSFAAGIGLKIGGWEVINLTVSDLKLLGGWGNELSISINTSFRF